MNMFFNFGGEWCTFDKQKDVQNLKALLDNYFPSTLWTSKDSQNLMKWPQIHGGATSSLINIIAKRNL
jgi:hypothetical protein